MLKKKDNKILKESPLEKLIDRFNIAFEDRAKAYIKDNHIYIEIGDRTAIFSLPAFETCAFTGEFEGVKAIL